jgi:hypothetical protein
MVHYILKLEGKERTTITCFLWVWWDARNKANAEERLPTVEEVQHRTMEVAMNSELLQRLTAKQNNVHRNV